jgi:hypothetical protein
MAYIGKTNWTNNEIVEAADLNRIEKGIENSVEKVAGKGLSTNDYTTAEKNKLAGIAAQATKNDTDANLRNRATHTGTQSADTIVDGTTNKVFTATEKTKLAGIATGATKNSTDATLLSRANHTGTQSADTITDGTTNKVFTAAEKTKLANIESGANKYTHPATHPASMITGLPTSLPANGGNADTVGGFTVGVNVPANAKFTDTTYSEITISEIDAGTASTLRTITGRRIKYILDKVQAWLDNKVDKVSGKGLSTNDYTTAEKNKLAGIEAGANNYTHPATHPASMITGLPTSLPANGGNADTVGGFTVGVNVPANAKFTDTITIINGKTGVITKADIVALGIPAQDTVTPVVDSLTSTSTTSALSANQGKVLAEQISAKTQAFTTTLDAVWTGSSAPYSKTVTVTGILETDTPIIDVVMSGTYATDEARQEAWAGIYRAVTANNSITFYATEKPGVSLPIQIKVVR